MDNLDFLLNVSGVTALFALFWHVVNFAVILKNRKEFKPLSGLNPSHSRQSISILIPARNEENTLPLLLESIVSQTQKPFEVLVYNDFSEDRTVENAQEFTSKIDRLRILEPVPRPDGWLGKNWACHQLAHNAMSDILLFIDADVTLEPDAVKDTLAQFEVFNPGLLTVWPRQILESRTERAVLTTMYFSLLAFLPAAYTERKPRWMPAFLYPFFHSKFAAACGQFMAFSKSVYDQIGGHNSVAHHVVEDVELAKRVRTQGFSVHMRNGTGSVNCRMYDSAEALFSGFRKNFFAGFGYNWFAFLFMATAHIVVYFGPLFQVFSPVFEIRLLGLLSLSLLLGSRILLLKFYEYPAWWSLLTWNGVLWFEKLGAVCMIDRITGRKPVWKNRIV